MNQGGRAWPFATVIAAALGCAWYINHARPEAHLPPDVVARVGARSIGRAEFEAAAAQLTLDLQPHASRQVRAEVLRKLIDEELLYRDGMALDLPETDPVVRLAIVRAMIAMVNAPTPLNDSAVQAAQSLQVQGGIDRYIDWLRHRATIEFQGAP